MPPTSPGQPSLPVLRSRRLRLGIIAVLVALSGFVPPALVSHSGSAADSVDYISDDVSVPDVLRVPSGDGIPGDLAASALPHRKPADLVTASSCGGRTRVVGRGQVPIPILMYHYVRVNPNQNDRLGYNLSVPPHDFRQQMDWLSSNGYQTISFRDLEAALLAHRPLPDCRVLLTFDDGYADFYNAARPVLREYHFTATSYIVNHFLDRPGFMTTDNVRELDREGFTVGAHTLDHSDLAALPSGEAVAEIVRSGLGLQALLGHPIYDFCYPAGRYNDSVVAEVRAAGYHTATTTQYGDLQDAGNLLTLSRIRISGGESLGAFAAAIEGGVAPGPLDTTVAAGG
ncbi:MAG: polysaccharide deacetylase family protein [Candidatus Dormibacteria bacterium]